VVEGQHVTSTRKLVDSREEHELLERMIDDAKPRVPADCAGAHYLLSTPFRYPPLKYGSRFGDRTQRSLWYGAETVETCLCETAFYRFWFLRDSDAALAPLSTEHTAFRVRVQSPRAIDLTNPPFSASAPRLASKTEFGDAQQIGADMRAAAVDCFRYFSARHAGGICVGVFTCAAFAGPPFGEQSWHCYTDRTSVEFTWRMEMKRVAFPLETFLVDGKLPPRPC
jgi:hypothetical protein